MICTNCSQNLGPIAILDIDGTLGDYHKHFLRFAAMYLGIDLMPPGRKMYTGSEGFREWFCATFDTDTRVFRDIKLAYRQGAQKRSMPVFKHSRLLVSELRRAGAEIWLATTRPYMRLDAVDPDTRFWLKRHGIKYDHMLYDDHKYELLSHQIDRDRVALVLDDQHDDLAEAEVFFGSSVCVLYANSWNSAFLPDWPSVDSEVVRPAMLEKVNEWNAKYSSSVPT